MKVIANTALIDEGHPACGSEIQLGAAVASGKKLSSEQLFGASNEVLIQHQDETYILRLTKQNKLILTK